MADTLGNFLKNLSNLLTSEAKLLLGVEEKVTLLQQEFERITGFLKDSEGKQDKDEIVKVLIRQIKKVTYEAEDVIDKYVVDVDTHRRRGSLGQFFNGFDHAKMLHSVNNQIEKIKDRIKAIYDNKDKYGIVEGESAKAKEEEAVAVAKQVQMRRTEVEENDVVGFDEYAEEVTKLLVEGDTSPLQLVSIVGMVGLGKTTLARRIYKDPLIKKHFADCCLWEFVTKEFDAKELLISLLKSVNEIPEDELKNLNKDNKKKESDSISKIPEDELKNLKKDNKKKESDSISKAHELVFLKNTLRQYLSKMKYLIVLDDMWSSKVLEEIGDAFPNDNMGSRILITTRFEHVTSNSKILRSRLYNLGRLSEEDSWILLSKKVFVEEKCSPTMESMGRGIASSCKGLPLSIVVIAGILRYKEKSERVWEKVVGNVNRYIKEDKEEDEVVKEIVKLSYKTLPPKYKPCFLYFGIYPEDYDIPVRQLIQLWIAEGFIPEDDKMTKEDVGEEYLEELIRRNLIQVESRRTDGGVKTCRIHDLLRELCINESKDDNFLEVRTDISISKEGKPRRLSLHCSTDHYMSATSSDHSTTRSLFSFSKDEYNASDYKTWLQKNFKLIRLLDMGQVKSSSLVLGEIEELIHLRYVRTRGSHSFSLKKSIYNLWNLETLDLRGSKLNALPAGIWKLERLRHLHMSASKATVLPDIPGRKILPNLQTLSVVCLDKKTSQQLEKGKFPNLRKLGVICPRWAGSSFIQYLQRLQCLKHLSTMKVIHDSPALGSVEGLPPNITKITLVGGSSLSETVNTLGSLPKLRYLKISGAKSDELVKFELECIESGGFQQLQVLKMKDLDIVSWKLGQGAMPVLHRLVINGCEFSTDLPTHQPLTTLKEVQVFWSSEAVVDKLQHLVLKDKCKFTVYGAPDE